MADEPDQAKVEVGGFEKVKMALHEILASPFADQESLLRVFVRDLKESHPKTAAAIAQAKRDGLLLFVAFKSALNSALGRTDLSDDQKRAALDEAGDFIADLLTIRHVPHLSVPPDAAIEFAMSALLVGMYSGLRPKEIDRLFRAKQSDRGKRSATRRQEKSASWVTYATGQAKAVRAKHPKYSQEKVAGAIRESWAAGCERPGQRTLVRFVSRLEQDGEIPQQKKFATNRFK
jgi:hypothetical protein